MCTVCGYFLCAVRILHVLGSTGAKRITGYAAIIFVIIFFFLRPVFRFGFRYLWAGSLYPRFICVLLSSFGISPADKFTAKGCSLSFNKRSHLSFGQAASRKFYFDRSGYSSMRMGAPGSRHPLDPDLIRHAKPNRSALPADSFPLPRRSHGRYAFFTLCICICSIALPSRARCARSFPDQWPFLFLNII